MRRRSDPRRGGIRVRVWAAALVMAALAAGAGAADAPVKKPAPPRPGSRPAATPDPYHLKPGARGTVCLDCHSELQDILKLPYVHTPVKTGDCAGCHEPHAATHARLLPDDIGALCARCHGGVVPKEARSVHPPVAQARCVACHNPHGSKTRGNLVAGGNALCSTCHADLVRAAAEAPFRHPPAEKTCLACHDPHASGRAPFLLKKEVPALCADCHRTDQPVFAKQHMNYPVAKARCTSCHDPHGSSNKAILWSTVHPPVLNRMCAQCHQDPGSPAPLALRKTGYEICRGCHSGLVNETLSKNRPHWPVLDRVGCRNCHEPHAARFKALLREPLKITCGRCHADTLARQETSAVKHPPVDEGQCVACHAPHGSDSVYLLKGPSAIGVCGSCHDWKSHSSHPIGEKTIDPRNANLTLDCLSCHRSHGTPFKSFAWYDPAADLCVQCHPAVRR